MPGAPKNPNNIASSFFNTVYLLRFEHGGAKLVSCHLTSARPCLQRPEIFPKFFEINEKQCATNTRKCPAANYIGVFWQSAKKMRRQHDRVRLLPLCKVTSMTGGSRSFFSRLRQTSKFRCERVTICMHKKISSGKS